jgi:flavin reductase (DIM6/NTAB) family NADH-FMN oxidoreductase RutF
MHMNAEPSILYFGTPVVLLSTLNDDGSANIAPMSSVWWLGWNCMLGLGAKGHTAQNLLREKECVLNLPAASLVENVNKLARLTGSNPVPPHKQAMGYRYEKDKFTVAGLSPTSSDLVVCRIETNIIELTSNEVCLLLPRRLRSLPKSGVNWNR